MKKIFDTTDWVLFIKCFAWIGILGHSWDLIQLIPLTLSEKNLDLFLSIWTYNWKIDNPALGIKVLLSTVIIDICAITFWIAILNMRNWARIGIMLLRIIMNSKSLIIGYLIVLFSLETVLIYNFITVSVTVVIIYFFTRPKVKEQLK